MCHGSHDAENDEKEGPAEMENHRQHVDGADFDTDGADDAHGGGTSSEDDASLTVLDAILLDCYNSVDRLLVLRAALSETLSKGWMDMARARYAMGPSRIGETLFSLKPEPPSILVSVSQDDEHSTLSRTCNIDDELQLENDEKDTFTRRFSLKARQDNDAKDKPTMLRGSLVSPHLKLAQSSFQTALKNLVEIASIQSDILNAEDELLRLRKGAGTSS